MARQRRAGRYDSALWRRGLLGSPVSDTTLHRLSVERPLARRSGPPADGAPAGAGGGGARGRCSPPIGRTTPAAGYRTRSGDVVVTE